MYSNNGHYHELRKCISDVLNIINIIILLNIINVLNIIHKG